MGIYLEVHPVDPQPRLIRQAADVVRDGGLIAYPTDSGYALGCQLGNAAALDRIRRIRDLDSKHHFTLVCQDFSQLSQFVRVSNSAFRIVKASSPGSYTFILPATREVPRRLMHPKKHTVGVRIPPNPVAQALVAELGEPLISSTLMLPGEDLPLFNGADVRDRLEHDLDAIVDSGDSGMEPTTVVDLSEGEPVVVRVGAGDPSRFE